MKKTNHRDYVLEQAKKNIERVSKDSSYVPQAHQVNSSLATIVAMDRNEVMEAAIELQKIKTLNLPDAD